MSDIFFHSVAADEECGSAREIQSKVTEDLSKSRRSYSVCASCRAIKCVRCWRKSTFAAARQVLKCETLTGPKWRKRASGAKTFCQAPPPLWPYFRRRTKSETAEPFSRRAHTERTAGVLSLLGTNSTHRRDKKSSTMLNWFRSTFNSMGPSRVANRDKRSEECVFWEPIFMRHVPQIKLEYWEDARPDLKFLGWLDHF